jgi:hypothetical protein
MEKDYMEILLEEMRGKFDLVLEGHATLNAKIDALDRKIDEKHDLTMFLLKALAADLSAHRADTEAHPRYLVREQPATSSHMVKVPEPVTICDQFSLLCCSQPYSPKST